MRAIEGKLLGRVSGISNTEFVGALTRLPELTVKIETAGGPVLWVATVNCGANTVGVQISVGCLIDGVAQPLVGRKYCQIALAIESMAYSDVAILGPGTHEFALAGAVSGGAANAASQPSSLVVIGLS